MTTKTPDTCPTCGSRVRVVSSDEGTSHYKPYGDMDLAYEAGLEDGAAAERASEQVQVLREALGELAAALSDPVSPCSSSPLGSLAFYTRTVGSRERVEAYERVRDATHAANRALAATEFTPQDPPDVAQESSVAETKAFDPLVPEHIAALRAEPTPQASDVAQEGGCPFCERAKNAPGPVAILAALRAAIESGDRP